MKPNKSLLIAALTVLLSAGVAKAASCHDDGAPDEAKMQAIKASETSIFNLEGKWTDQSGKTLQLTSLSGKPRLVVMGFTSCPTACPMLVSEMKSVVNRLSDKEKSKLGLTLFSLDSERDRPEALRAFRDKMKLDGDSWVLLTAPSADVNELAAVLGVQFKRLDSGDFIHSNVIFLLNEKGEVVSRKDGLNTPSDDFIQDVRQALKGT